MEIKKLETRIFITRYIDELGRVTIPKEIIDQNNWRMGRFVFKKIDAGKIEAINVDENVEARRLDELNRLCIPKSLRFDRKKCSMDFYKEGLILILE